MIRISPLTNVTAVDLREVEGGYEATPVLSGVSLSIQAGDFVGLVGPSGAGKTSLLLALLGALPWISGSVVLGGRAVMPGRPAGGIGYVPQTQTVDWSFPATVEDVVLMGRIQRMGPWPWPSQADRAAARGILERLGLGGLGRRHIRDLSGGQRQRAFLARAVIGEPSLLLLDEPTAGVDLATRDTVLNQLRELHRHGMTIVMTTHELNAVAATLPRLICLNRTVIARGPPDQVFTEPILSRTFDAPIRVVADQVTGRPLVVEGAGRELVGRGAE
ncbi:MAG: metal ABC transporter ATP-binding protein [Chloroflexota bacterium]|nr:metal ABC transporter ATP-binding protein [Chloroflexota bacterium]